MGDLRGVIDRLEYLQWLGVRAVWLTPIYPSPLADLGYDVRDFQSIEPRFGTMDDFDALIAEAHRRDLKIILDWVPNHTSDEHPWFVESRSNQENPKREWYIWRDPKPDGSPPNNWISVFGGSVWQWDPQTEQFYLHTFLEKQPDLNWRNPDVQSAMLDTLRFWLGRGVDGFRIDALDLLIKDDQFRDNPPNPDYQEGQGPDNRLLPTFTRDQPGIHEIVARIRGVVDEYRNDTMLAGELYLPIEKIMAYYGNQSPELQLPLNLKLAWTTWNAEEVGRIIRQYEQQVPPQGWPTWTLSTHDCLRLAMRCRGEQIRVAAMLLCTLRGTPTHYYGEEVGMRGVPIPAEQATDPQGRRIGRNRDPERTPMQWSGEQHAGFSSAEPWLPVAEDFQMANVVSQSENATSLLTLYRRLFVLRSKESTLVIGRYEAVECRKPLLAYRRISDDTLFLIVLNLGNDPQIYELDQSPRGHVTLSTFLDREGEKVLPKLELRGDEGLIISLENPSGGTNGR
jgi:alpha-glucosidase